MTRRSIAVVAGSGMNGLADGFETVASTAFAEIPGVGPCTVAGHRGEVRTCRVGRGEVRFVLGRRHFYEGTPVAMRLLIRWLAQQGVTDLVVTSAAGSLRRDAPAGEIVLVHDIFDMQNRERDPVARRIGARLLVGRGPDRPVMRTAVDRDLAAAIEDAARAAGVALRRGTLVCGAGPTYETPAEVRFLQESGGDLVTMSAAPEVVFALTEGLRVAALGALTNPATGIDGSVPAHAEVVEVGARSALSLAGIVHNLV